MAKREKKGGGPAAIYKMVTDRIIDKLEEGVIAWRKPWRGVPGDGVPANLVSKRPYNGSNELLLGMMGYDQPWWLSLKQANDLGGTIRKGESPMPVVWWKRYERVLRDGEEARGRVITDDRGRKIAVGFMLRYFKVWNVEQVDGIEHRIPEYVEPEEYAPHALDEVLADYCSVEGVRLLKPGGDRAYYDLARDAIKLPPAAAFTAKLGEHAGREARAATWAHECIHSTGVAKRLERDMSGGMGSGDYSREELVAEFGAQMLCTRFGLSNDHLIDNAAAYIASWAERLAADPQLLMQAASRAQSAAEYVAPLVYGAELVTDAGGDDAEPAGAAA